MQQINTKKFKTRHDKIGKVIHGELCKEMKLNHTNKWYMHNLENDTHKFLWDFEILTDHLISARRPDQVMVNNNKNEKRKLANCRLYSSGWPQSKTERYR